MKIEIGLRHVIAQKRLINKKNVFYLLRSIKIKYNFVMFERKPLRFIAYNKEPFIKPNLKTNLKTVLPIELHYFLINLRNCNGTID